MEMELLKILAIVWLSIFSIGILVIILVFLECFIANRKTIKGWRTKINRRPTPQIDKPISAMAIEGHGKLTWSTSTSSSDERMADLPSHMPPVANGRMLVMVLTAISKHRRLALNVSTPEMYLEAMKKLDLGIYFKADLYTLAEEHFDRCFGSDDHWETDES